MMIKNIKNIEKLKIVSIPVFDDSLEFISNGIGYNYCIHMGYIIELLNISFMCLLIEMICIIPL